jgi:hypothetical protein
MDNGEIDRKLDDLVQHLPAELRKDWVVIPKQTIHKLFVAAFLLGAGVASLVTGLILDISSLKWVYPAVLIAMALLTKYVPWWREDRSIKQLRGLDNEDCA